MNLSKVHIENYRSIVSLSFSFDEPNGVSTIGLIGLNEAGKTNILRALDLTAKGRTLTRKDFRNAAQPVLIVLRYKGHPTSIADHLSSINLVAEEFKVLANNAGSTGIELRVQFDEPGQSPTCAFKVDGIDALIPVPDAEKFPHKAIFWSSEERYLIAKSISLSEFAASPEKVSVPLRNCFLLAGIDDIQARVTLAKNDSTDAEHLQDVLGAAVTEHIRAVWPDHPIRITFRIDGDAINFHIKDEGQQGKANTADQRSDGFRQFVSFLLTVSAENKNEELNNTLLLLDEPETHLHPKAQEYLLNELVRITANDRGNFAIFSTHSNYLIDKQRLDRNWAVRKAEGATIVSRFPAKASTYASVAYEVFEVESTDYLNELYGRLHEKFIELDEDDVNRRYISTFDAAVLVGQFGNQAIYPQKQKANAVTLPTYVRNCIHHPEGEHTFTQEELRDAIEVLRSVERQQAGA